MANEEETKQDPADTAPIDLTDEMIEVCAKAFFNDCQHDKDYELKSWEEQFDEFKKLLATDGISPSFLIFCYNSNKGGFN